MIGKHYHPNFEILYYTEGHLTMIIKDRTFELGAGDLVLINPLHMHTSIYPDDCSTERIMCRFNRAFLRSVLDDPAENLNIVARFRSEDNIIHLTGQVRERVERIFAGMLEEKEREDRYSGVISRILLAELLVLACRYFAEHEKAERPQVRVTQKAVSDITTYICANYADEITLTSLADRFCMSRCYLARIFKRHTGFSVTQFVNNVRVTQAARLLKPGSRVSEVALQVGFNNISHFGRIFRKCMGISPQGYRTSEWDAHWRGGEDL